MKNFKIESIETSHHLRSEAEENLAAVENVLAMFALHTEGHPYPVYFALTSKGKFVDVDPDFSFDTLDEYIEFAHDENQDQTMEDNKEAYKIGLDMTEQLHNFLDSYGAALAFFNQYTMEGEVDVPTKGLYAIGWEDLANGFEGFMQKSTVFKGYTFSVVTNRHFKIVKK